MFVAGWRHALRSEWPFIIIIILGKGAWAWGRARGYGSGPAAGTAAVRRDFGGWVVA